MARGPNCRADFWRILEQLDSQRNLATVARLLVGSERGRSLFTAVHGIRRVQVRPTSGEVTTAFARIMPAEWSQPKHLIVDQGPEFECDHFEKTWCNALNILPRLVSRKAWQHRGGRKLPSDGQGTPAIDHHPRGPASV